MKIKIDQAPLLSALDACAKVADQKSPYPWGACVTLDTSNPNALTCRASNSLQSVTRTAGGMATVKRGAVMLNAKDALQRVAALDAGEVVIEELPGSVRISQGGAKYTLPKYDASTAPAVATVKPQGGEVDAAAFGALLGRASVAMGTNESQLSTWGVSVSTGGGKMWARAINGKVAAIAPMTFDGDLVAMIPSPAVKQLQTVLSKIDGPARVAVVGTSLHVFADGFEYSTMLSGEAPPKFDGAIPKREGASVQVDRAATVKAIKAVTIGDARDARLRLRAGPKGITFRGLGSDAKENERLVSCDCGIASLSCAPAYLLDLLEFSNESTVTLWINPGKRVDGGAPEPITIEEDGALCVAQPLNYDAEDLRADAAE